MPKKVAHIIQKEIMHHHRAQVSEGNVMTPYTVFYYCGKIDQYLHETRPEYTEADRKAFASFERKEELNPTPPCKRCQIARLKALSPTPKKDV